MNKESNLHVFIGYDEKQDLAWEVCAESLRSQASKPVSIWKLDHRLLRSLDLFKRTWEIEGNTGRYKDVADGKPFSTQFAHSRFLVPEMCKHLGVASDDVAIFVDSDFVFLSDPYEIITEIRAKEEKCVWVVKHDYTPKTATKMDSQVQIAYSMKLWSSLMVFDLRFNTGLTKEIVNEKSGRWLHTFEWTNGPHEIGALDERWNFIPDHSEENANVHNIGAIHWTEGLPCIPGYEYCRYAATWRDVERRVLEKKLRGS